MEVTTTVIETPKKKHALIPFHVERMVNEIQALEKRNFV